MRARGALSQCCESAAEVPLTVNLTPGTTAMSAGRRCTMEENARRITSVLSMTRMLLLRTRLNGYGHDVLDMADMVGALTTAPVATFSHPCGRMTSNRMNALGGSLFIALM
jgi:hypothetical protein